MISSVIDRYGTIRCRHCSRRVWWVTALSVPVDLGRVHARQVGDLRRQHVGVDCGQAAKRSTCLLQQAHGRCRPLGRPSATTEIHQRQRTAHTEATTVTTRCSVIRHDAGQMYGNFSLMGSIGAGAATGGLPVRRFAAAGRTLRRTSPKLE